MGDLPQDLQGGVGAAGLQVAPGGAGHPGELCGLGLAEAAGGGDLFLDEIEALPLTQQAKLLRFLETGEIRRVGASATIHVETRVIAATNEPLEKLVEQDKFREDLLWRLKGKNLELPPLKERLEDVEILARHFLAQRPAQTKTLDADAIEALKAYTWPGNVRELKRVCEQLLLLAPLPIIRSQDISQALPKLTAVDQSKTETSVDLSIGLNALITNYEKVILQKALDHCQDVDEASRTLGISRSTLYKKLKDHDIEWRNS